MSDTFDAIFFDLDGTLLDTSPDLLHALNTLLARYDVEPVPLDEFRYHIYGGTETMLGFGFAIDADHPNYPELRREYLDIYRDHLAVHTELYRGIETLLHHLEQHDFPWGIVTNKPGWLTDPLLDNMGLSERCISIVSGDTLPTRKPDPAPLLHACALADCDPTRSIYVGDTETDIIAAKAAGMLAVGVRYGYHPKNSDPREWDSDLLVDDASHLIDWLSEQLNHA